MKGSLSLLLSQIDALISSDDLNHDGISRLTNEVARALFGGYGTNGGCTNDSCSAGNNGGCTNPGCTGGANTTCSNTHCT